MNERSRIGFFAIIASGVAAGVLNTGLVAAINEALSAEGSRTAVDTLLYATLALAVLITNTMPELLVSRLTRGLALELRRRLASTLMTASLAQFERFGTAAFFTAFGKDLDDVVALARTLPVLAICGTISIGCIAYVGWLEPGGLVIVVPGIVLFAILRLISIRFLRPRRQEHRRHYEQLIHQHNELLSGIKELKVNLSVAKRGLPEGNWSRVYAA